MTIKSTLRNATYSVDPIAADIGRFLGRRAALTASERHEPTLPTPTRSLEERYPSLFETPRRRTLSDAVAGTVDALTAVVILVRRRVLRRRAARGRRARGLS